ncbi:hypothetical protein CL619_03825 [archaeon]|nr:hypothetical protein [archaeon]|tara:strand:+ start:287 stop:1378 length:1092 start_codon:yes stop_codon:yes gene_type:complete
MADKKQFFLFFFLLITISLFLISCSTEEANLPPKPESSSETITIPDANGRHFTQFTLNVHDWVFPERSIDSVTRTIEIHEEYQIPVDIYLNDQTFQVYLEQAPELIERLKTSEYVTINYHIRAPHPAYNGFDNYGLEEMSDQEIYQTILDIEEHRLDLETGLYLEDEAGGYQLIKDTLGYAPIALGFSATGRTAETMAQVYKEKGAKLYIVHGRDAILGETENGLYLRPEHVEIKWYEEVMRYIRDGETPGEVIQSFIDEGAYTEEEGLFINMKMHENNYYTVGTSFAPAFWEDYENKQGPLDPPYLIDLPAEIIEMRDNSYTTGMWDWYETTVQYVAEHDDEYYAISNKDILEWLGEEVETS